MMASGFQGRVVVTEQDLGGGSAVKSTYVVIHNTVIPVPDDPIPSSSLCGHRHYTCEKSTFFFFLFLFETLGFSV